MKKQQNRNEKLLQTKCTTAWRGRNGPAALPSPALPLYTLLTLTSPPSLAATSATGVDWHVRLPLVWHLPAQLGGHCTCLGCMTAPPSPSVGKPPPPPSVAQLGISMSRICRWNFDGTTKAQQPQTTLRFFISKCILISVASTYPRPLPHSSFFTPHSSLCFRVFYSL